MGHMEKRSVITFSHGLDLFVAVSHLAIGVLATFAFGAIEHLATVPKVTIALIYAAAAVSVYRWLHRRARIETQSDVDAVGAELEKWKRYFLLQSGVSRIAGEFLKERYQLNHHVVGDIESLLARGRTAVSEYVAVIGEADKERRAQIKSALGQLSSTFVDDFCEKPKSADQAIADHFKLSYYGVEKEGATEVLKPKWRFYPNEGEPRTKQFRMGEGASGRAWEQKRIIVCEDGGQDPGFKDMWEGGGQRSHYASMVCVPAIVDIPADRLSVVRGILTVDTPIRHGYFAKALEQFWADLLQPICNILIYLDESEKLVRTIIEVLNACNGNAQPDASLDASSEAGAETPRRVPRDN
jgi:hypothetical protein